jgi:hypothetical protein
MPTTVRQIQQPVDGDLATGESINRALRELSDLLDVQQHLPLFVSWQQTQRDIRSVVWNSVLSQWCAVGHNTNANIGSVYTLEPGFGVDSGAMRQYLPAATATKVAAGENDWTAASSLGGAQELNDVAINTAGLYVAVGQNGWIATSADGDTWTQRTPAGGFADTFYSVAWNGSVFVIVGDDGQIQTSPDGVTWTQRTPSSGFTGDFYRVRWDGTRVVAVGSGGEIQTSADAINWDRSVAGAGNAAWLGVACNANVTLIVGHDGSGGGGSSGNTANATMSVSLDHGLTFTPLAVPTISAAAFRDCSYCANSDVFCVVGMFLAAAADHPRAVILMGNPTRENWVLVDAPDRKQTTGVIGQGAKAVGCDGRRFCIGFFHDSASDAGHIYFSNAALGRRV